MVDTWRSDGFAADRLEVWAVGWPGQEGNIQSWAQGSTVPCLIDTNTDFMWAYSADKDDLWVVGKTGSVSFSMNLIAQPISSSPYNTQLDNAVRAALQ